MRPSGRTWTSPGRSVVDAVVPGLVDFVPAFGMGVAIEVEGGLVAPVGRAPEVWRVDQAVGLAEVGEQGLGGPRGEAAIEERPAG